jgi:GTPase
MKSVANEFKKEKEEKEVCAMDVRVAICGTVDAGKSTLVGVLTGGKLDNGRGLARAQVFNHDHEQRTGRTSSIAMHLLGFDKKGEAIRSEREKSSKSYWRSIVEKSDHLITFVDMCGHDAYLKTTISGLCGTHPHYAIVLVNGLAGVQKMTREHMGVLLALQIPFICVITKIDLAPANVLERTQSALVRLLKSQHVRKVPFVVRESKDIATCIENVAVHSKLCPIFVLSSVTGKSIDLLTLYLSQLTIPSLTIPSSDQNDMNNLTEFHLDETWLVPGVGLCVSGTLMRGTLYEQQVLKLGPNSDGSFTNVIIRSIQYKRMPVTKCSAGMSCAVSIRATGPSAKKEAVKRVNIRRGMVLLDPKIDIVGKWEFDAEVLILHHPTTIKCGYQPVVHIGAIRQTASIIKITPIKEETTTQDKEINSSLRTGDRAIVTFRFISKPEFIPPNITFIFREGATKGTGRVISSTPPIVTPNPTVVTAQSLPVTTAIKSLIETTTPTTSIAATEAVSLSSTEAPLTKIYGSEMKSGDGVNLDVTGFLFLISGLTNEVHTQASIDRDYPKLFSSPLTTTAAVTEDKSVSFIVDKKNRRWRPEEQGRMNALEEMEERSLPPVLEKLNNKKLFMCTTAKKQCDELVALLADDAEKKRAAEWMAKITIVPDNPSERSKQLSKKNLPSKDSTDSGAADAKNSRGRRNRFRANNITIFGTGDQLGLTTLTSNHYFVRSSLDAHVKFDVILVPARPLKCIGRSHPKLLTSK